jgi:sulfate adenylyltransferase large subunit
MTATELEVPAVVDLLRFATIGSVDDGKSTVIGRLLVDTRQLFDDQLDAVVEASRNRGVGEVDLSFVTDGLRAEREQGITIDVAYRYAATPKRKFVIADCPGHVQYTANMATGASNADLALVVVDATSGVKEQTRRHLCIAALLGVRQLIVCANKMDLVDWSEAAYGEVVAEMEQLSATLGIESLTVIPISALYGDNVVERSSAAHFYRGPTVLEALESASTGDWASSHGEGAARATRLPVQWIIRQPGGGRAYAGMVDGASIRVGDEVVVLPDGLRSTISAIETPSGRADEAAVGRSVSVFLKDDLDVSRGDLIVGSTDLPSVSSEFSATLCWFTPAPLHANARYRIKHTTRSTPASISSIEARLDVNELALVPVDELVNNDIGVVVVKTASPLAIDSYAHNRITGSFVLIDEVSNVTVAAGMVGPPLLLEH